MEIRPPRQASTWIALTSILFLLTAGSACMRATSPPLPAPPKLDCALSADEPLLAGGPINIRFTLTNRGDATLYVLRWYTPLEGVRSDLFVIAPQKSPDGAAQPLPYQGALAKRADPGRDDYAELAPGQSVDRAVDVAPAYGLDQPGTYKVEFQRGLSDLATDPAELPRKSDLHRAVPLSCAPLLIEVAAGTSR